MGTILYIGMVDNGYPKLTIPNGEKWSKWSSGWSKWFYRPCGALPIYKDYTTVRFKNNQGPGKDARNAPRREIIGIRAKGITEICKYIYNWKLIEQREICILTRFRFFEIKQRDSFWLPSSPR